MTADEKRLQNLREITDRLHGGMFAELDDAALTVYFGTKNDRADIAAAEAFAKQEGCAWWYDAKSRVGKFGRAYSKRAGP